MATSDNDHLDGSDFELVERLIDQFSLESAEVFALNANAWMIHLANNYSHQLIGMMNHEGDHAFRNIQNHLNDLKTIIVRLGCWLLEKCHYDQESSEHSFCYRAILMEPDQGSITPSNQILQRTLDTTNNWGLFPISLEPDEKAESSLVGNQLHDPVHGFQIHESDKSAAVVKSFLSHTPILIDDTEAPTEFSWLNNKHRSRSLFVYPLFLTQPNLVSNETKHHNTIFSFGALCIDSPVSNTWSRHSVTSQILSNRIKPVRNALLILYATELVLANTYHDEYCLSRYSSIIHE